MTLFVFAHAKMIACSQRVSSALAEVQRPCRPLSLHHTVLFSNGWGRLLWGVLSWTWGFILHVCCCVDYTVRLCGVTVYLIPTLTKDGVAFVTSTYIRRACFVVIIFVQFTVVGHCCDAKQEMPDGEGTTTLYCARAQKKSERQRELQSKHDQVKMERMNKFQGVNVYVKNLDEGVTEEAMREAFAQYGTITR